MGERLCGSERNDSKTALHESSDTSRSSKQETCHWYRYAKHRRFRVAPTEHLTDLSTLASAIRTLSKTLDKAERFLVLVNPCSGKKRGLIEYEKVLRPMLEQAGICHDCLITTHPNHARERMQSQDFKDILCLGNRGEMLYL